MEGAWREYAWIIVREGVVESVEAILDDSVT
jgi:hypothetical protein